MPHALLSRSPRDPSASPVAVRIAVPPAMLATLDTGGEPAQAPLVRHVPLVRHALLRRDLAWRRRRKLALWLVALGSVTFMSLVVALSVLASGRFTSRPDARAGRARLQLQKYAFEAYPSWRASHHGRMCPRSLRELAPYTSTHGPDPWGSPLEFRCGPMLPHGATGLWLRSAGADRRFGTDDDLVSSE